MGDHLTGNALLDPFQSAYRKYHSTETALLKVHSELAEALDNGHAAVLLMLDLSAAFDMLDHQIVIERLRHMYGFQGDVLAWIRSKAGCIH